MALLPILRYPDPRLHTVATPVVRVDDEVRKLIADMAETMYEAPGIGLAATQVNVHMRVVVIDVSEDKSGLMTLINPEILERSGEQVCEEGCLSVPMDFRADVLRSETIDLKALDLDGNVIDRDIDGFEAIIVQHETDHLNGVLLVDRMSPMQRMSVSGQLKRLQKKI